MFSAIGSAVCASFSSVVVSSLDGAVFGSTCVAASGVTGVVVVIVTEGVREARVREVAVRESGVG